jgi:hypothetical protein
MRCRCLSTVVGPDENRDVIAQFDSCVFESTVVSQSVCVKMQLLFPFELIDSSS